MRNTDKNITDPKENFPLKVGILTSNFNNGIVKSDVPGKFEDIFIPREKFNGAPLGMRVLCRITEDYYPNGYDTSYIFKDEFSGMGMPKGEIVEVLGNPVSDDSTMKGIILSHNLRSEFKKKVLGQVNLLPDEVSKKEIQEELARGRLDLRQETIVTIDGEDTKDIDDGISLKKEDNITYLSVHIADVSHYVKDNSHIDKEALERGCSVYMADRVLPMLPPKLSNNLCSLNPGKERFALTACLGFDRNIDLVSLSINESVIKSHARLTYNEVFEMLSKEPVKKTLYYTKMLRDIKELSESLRKKRIEKGYVDFDFTETKLVLDEENNVLDVKPFKTNFAHEIIEECMIACNVAIAEEFADKQVPFIYRIHDKPDSQKVLEFKKLASLLGEKVKFKNDPSPKDIQKIVNEISDKKYKETLMQVILRMMAKASYSHTRKGHFGLALDNYCHFTSPIRRYPDLFIHRIIKAYINKKSIAKSMKQKAVDAGRLSSEAEIEAMQAERESVDYKTAQYMKQFVGETFKGTVTGMQDFGIFVRLDNTVEGLAPFRTSDTYYEYYEKDMTVRSITGNNVIRIGDTIDVKLIGADTIARRIEFMLLDSYKDGKKTKKRKRRKGKTGENG